MKRSLEDVSPADFGRTWSGLKHAATDQHVTEAVPDLENPTQKLVDAGVHLTKRSCDFCEHDIESDKAASCVHCDAGPFHEECILGHICTLPSSFLAPIEGEFPSSFSDAEAPSDEEAAGSVLAGAEEAEISEDKPPTWNSVAQAERLFHNKGPAKQIVEKTDRWRPTEPKYQPFVKGDPAKVDQILDSEEQFQQALREFEDDKFAASNNPAVQSRLEWWHSRAEKFGVAPYPLSQEKINTIGALLKAGGYRSAPQYFSSFKREHISKGHPWTDQLALSIKDAIRSITRGMGPEKQCPALDLRQVADMSEVSPVPGGPRFPKATVVLFAQFATREMEAALRKRSQITLHEGRGCGVVAMFLPVSKTDAVGAGVLRRQGCACSVNSELCPVKAARLIWDYGTQNGATESDPFLCGADIQIPPTKGAMVETFRKVAREIGWSEEASKSITGHLLRATGAQYFARCGVEFYKIQLFCRWGSDTILRYLRDAPLEESENWVSDAATKVQALDEIYLQTTSQMQRQGVKQKDVERIVHNALKAHSTDVLLTFEKEKQDIVAIVDSLKTQKIVMDDRWAAELSRRFLPKYVKNLSSKILHTVRDEFSAGCGFEWRNSKEYMLCHTAEGDFHKCEKQGCTKLFARFAAW